MKISYNTLKKYIKNIKNVEELAKDLIMHTAEVEEIVSQSKKFENIVYGKIKSIEEHENADSLKVCKVDAGENEDIQVVCGGSNLKVGQAIALAKIGAVVSWHGEETITMKKTKIRGIESNGMICASEEIGLKKEFPANDSKEILDFGEIEAIPGTNIADLLNKNNSILEIDNKAINHRPDLFSHIGIIREIYTISGEKFDFKYEENDFSKLNDLGIKNEINDLVKRYIALKVNNVENIDSPEYIKEVLYASGVESKGLLIDITNYSLYMYGQPTHIFDADKVDGNIIIRKARNGEKFIALDDKEYELFEKDIVIADDKKILALGGIIGGKDSCVSENTKNIIIEGANFDQATLRYTGKRLGIRTDSLNVFEKDILPDTAIYGISLIINELKKYFSNLELISFSDSYDVKQEKIIIEYDLSFINNLIGKEYKKEEAEKIITNLGIEISGNNLLIPNWRKDLNYKSDIAEEIARIDGYNNIDAKIPEIQLGAIIQDNTYKIKKLTRDFLVNKGFFEIYNYSFVNKNLMEKVKSNTNNLIPLKNYLSEEATHMKNSLIPNLLDSLEKNIKQTKNIKLFEIEKIFEKEGSEIKEEYYISGIITNDKDSILYYKIQNNLSDLLKHLGIDKFIYDTSDILPSYAHKGRTSKIIARGKEVGHIGEISPKVANNFGIKGKIGFFEINIEKIKEMVFSITKTKEFTTYQTSNFDLCFVIDKNIKGKDIKNTIEKTDTKLINKVELFDIYDMEDKRSISYKIHISNMESEITDEQKNKLINEIISKVEKKGGILR